MSNFTSKIYRLTGLLIIMYIQLTLSEVIIHKWIMHNKKGSISSFLYGDSHNIHHKQVLNDMKLDYNSEDKIQGLHFGWLEVFILLSIPFSVIWYYTFRLFKFYPSIFFTYVISVIVTLFYKYTWDFLHYKFHQIDELNVWNSNPVFNWYFKNHSYHHLIKGDHKGNYNIILPGGDFIFNTYRNCIDNTSYCEQNEHTICSKPKLKHNLKYCK